MNHSADSNQALYLAAEDCPEDEFAKLHVFVSHEERAIQALCAHGPVLIRGGRGSGKSAVMIEAARRLGHSEAMVLGIYMSLRSVPLLRSTGRQYEAMFCRLLSERVAKTLAERSIEHSFAHVDDVAALQSALVDLARGVGRRIVLMFDDVAHIGREASLEEFFGIFRTISTSSVSCKASIYPGVTRFGIRFDVYNDATVIDLGRDERSQGYADFFLRVLQARFPGLADGLDSAGSVQARDAAAFIGRTVVGNMRAFVIACGRLSAREEVGIPGIEAVLKDLASDYYWPLLEELEPKLGAYQPLVVTSKRIADLLFRHAAMQGRASTVIVHREIVQGLSKVFEILEYAGFISKREASRAMRSGGRGPRFALNLATLLEDIQPSRLTREVFSQWISFGSDSGAEVHASSDVLRVEQPAPASNTDLAVLGLPIEKLEKSNIYPYGLTPSKIEALKSAGFLTIGAVADASDAELRSVGNVGEKWVERIRSVVGQAVWM